MSQKFRRTLVSLVIAVLGFVLFEIYTSLFPTTRGPNFISALQEGLLTAKSVDSIEVIRKTPGVWEFTEAEYAKLTRIAVIDEPSTISEFLLGLASAPRTGYVHQNHPATPYINYVKFNLTNGEFYYAIVEICKDAVSDVCYFRAYPVNTTNPNGATMYLLNAYERTLGLVDPRFRNKVPVE